MGSIDLNDIPWKILSYIHNWYVDHVRIKIVAKVKLLIASTIDRRVSVKRSSI